MNVYNKIFVWPKGINVSNSITTNSQDGFVEYIRKDALLEWVKKEMKERSFESSTAQGVNMGLTLVLDKIESL